MFRLGDFAYYEPFFHEEGKKRINAPKRGLKSLAFLFWVAAFSKKPNLREKEEKKEKKEISTSIARGFKRCRQLHHHMGRLSKKEMIGLRRDLKPHITKEIHCRFRG